MFSKRTLLVLVLTVLLQQESTAAPKASLQGHADAAHNAMLHHNLTRAEHAHITQVRGQAALISESDLSNGCSGHRILGGTAIPEGYLVVTGDNDSFVELRCPDGALVKVWSNSILQVNAQEHLVYLQRGVAEFCLSKEDNSAYKVRTKTLVVDTKASTLCLTTALMRDSVTVMDGDAKVFDLVSGLPWNP